MQELTRRSDNPFLREGPVNARFRFPKPPFHVFAEHIRQLRGEENGFRDAAEHRYQVADIGKAIRLFIYSAWISSPQ